MTAWIPGWAKCKHCSHEPVITHSNPANYRWYCSNPDCPNHRRKSFLSWTDQPDWVEWKNTEPGIRLYALTDEQLSKRDAASVRYAIEGYKLKQDLKEPPPPEYIEATKEFQDVVQSQKNFRIELSPFFPGKAK